MSLASRKELRILILIALITLCGMLGIDIHLASFPQIMNDMHTNKTHMQQSVSLYLLGLGFSMLFYGPLSDQYGRKPMVVIGLTIAAVASFSSAYTIHIQTFLVTRLFQGLGAGVCMGLGQTMVADILQGARLATIGSYFAVVISLSPLLAPALGGYIQHWYGWQANFIVLGTLISISLFLYAFFCPETNYHKNPKAFSFKGLYKNYNQLLANPVFVIFTLISGIAITTNIAYVTISPFLLQLEFHMTPILYGWVTALVGVAGIVGKLMGATAIKRIGSLHTLLSGLFLLCFAGLWIALFASLYVVNVPLIMIAVFVSIVGQTFILPSAISYALSPHFDKRGTAGALYSSFQMLVAFITSVLITSFSHGGIWVLAFTYSALGLVGMVLLFKLPKTTSVQSKTTLRRQ